MKFESKPAAVLVGLLLLHVLAQIDRNVLVGFSPQITRELSLSNAQYGLLSGAVWVLSYGAMAVWMGTLADRFSRTRVMATGLLVWSACTVATGLAQSFEHMAMARFFVATGEAALVPAAVSLLSDAFSDERRGSAMGIFFIGIPLGIGMSFVIAGALGGSYGWRNTYFLLGAIGIAIALPLGLLRDRRGQPVQQQRGLPFVQQVAAVVVSLKQGLQLRQTVLGFVLLHFAFSGLAFVQLWLVRERGFDGSAIAKQMGMLQICFGTLGALVGGVASDRLHKSYKVGHATLLMLMVLVCAPLMVAYRLAAPGSVLFYMGMCAGFFLPLAAYGPAIAIIQGLTPDSRRATITGATMLLINVFPIAIGSFALGKVSDLLLQSGSQAPLSVVLLSTDILVAVSLLCFWRASSCANRPAVQQLPSPTEVIQA